MDDFEQLQFLGRGGYARIPRAKIVTEQQKLRLDAEKSILLKIKSPFLCRGFQVIETTDEVSFLQEYIEGRALYECIWKYRDTGRFPEHVAKFFAVQLVLALRDLHAQGYVHRDFKSGNVLVGKSGFVKVIDFGLSRKVVADGKVDDYSGRTQSVCGTHYVMAPEMFFKESYAFGVDWWSLGVVIYEMVMNHMWFNDINWALLESKEGVTDSMAVPYDFNKDYNPARIRTSPGQGGARESLSSAESIDPEDDAKYFADF
ncbi:hypothetical protein PInf_013180 [Phytophthora infestans]|nr:hypothetical protein PInf_013180 [Phytophthora infestans]